MTMCLTHPSCGLTVLVFLYYTLYTLRRTLPLRQTATLYSCPHRLYSRRRG